MDRDVGRKIEVCGDGIPLFLGSAKIEIRKRTLQEYIGTHGGDTAGNVDAGKGTGGTECTIC